MSSPSLATTVAAIVLDEGGCIVSADAETERLTGHPAGGLSGRPVGEMLTAPADRPRLQAALATAGAEGVARIELTLVHRDGGPVPAELTIVGGARLESPNTVMTIRDLTEQRRSEQLAVAAQAVATVIAGARSPEQALQGLLATLSQQMDWSRGTCWTVGAGNGLGLATAWPSGASDGEVPGPLVERARQASAATWQTDGEAGTRLAVPVTRGDALVGVIELCTDRPRAEDPAVAEALTVAGAQVGELLGVLEDRLSAMASLTRLALTDQLTGLPNRRAWEDALVRELARARRGGHPVCVAVLDIDDFKRFNDEHGHQAGDRILAETARAWQEQLRATDVLARYGGEEFAAVIPAWPLDQAVTVVERLRRATPGALTASAGIAGWNGAESGPSLFGRADAALYEAKQRGRDQTVAAAEPLPRDEPAAGDGRPA